MSKEVVRVTQAWRTIFVYSAKNRQRILTVSGSIVAVVAVLDIVCVHTVALGFLYVIPLVLAAGFLSRWQIVGISALCAILRETGSPLAWSSDYVARMALVAAAFAGTTLFVKELVRNQQVALDRVRELKDRHDLEHQLLHAQRLEAVGRLAGGIAHDFNNVLSVIIGFSELALHRLEPGSAASQDVEQVKSAANRAAGLTRQLLEFSRRDMLEPEVLDLNVLVAKLSQMLHRLISEDVDLRLDLGSRVSCIRADAASLEQVIMNLVVNARDAMPQGGVLTIRTGEADLRSRPDGIPPGIQPARYVTLTVQDTGVGMERNVQEHLFEPFFTTKEVGKGTGLGLSTVYGIVKQNGGEIWFATEKGQGTAFTIYFPPVESAPRPAPPPRHPRSVRPARATVLLVEDDDAVRCLAREVLARNGLTVVEASHPAEALQIARTRARPFDLVLTDVVMPGMSGPRMVEMLHESWPRLNVLFMTGYADPAALPPGFALQSASVIRKPISEDSLMQGVWGALC
jgi:signal transduction histidine kinase/CheY-like chemotaxis protein